MKITPQPNLIQLKFEEATAGALDTSSKDSSVECAEIIAVGKDVLDLSVGDKVFVKGWAIDIITYQDQRYYFVDVTTNGILAKVDG